MTGGDSYTAQKLATWSLCIYYAQIRGKNLSGMDIPLIGPHYLKNRRPKHTFLSLQQCPLFVSVRTFYQYWSLLGCLWDYGQTIDKAEAPLQEIPEKKDSSAESVRVDEDITTAALGEVETLTRPENWECLSKSAKRRVRKLMQKEQKLRISDVKALDRRHPIPKRLEDWRKKRTKEGKDVFSQCHTCWQFYSCGHRYTTLCRECDLSWDHRQAIQCPLWAMRVNGTWKPHRFLLFNQEPCTICPNVENTNANESARARYNRFCGLSLAMWDRWLTSRCTKLSRQDLFDCEDAYLCEKLDDEEYEEERDLYCEGLEFWRTDDAEFQFRDFRRQL
jgi:hypothetical protein